MFGFWSWPTLIAHVQCLNRQAYAYNCSSLEAREKNLAFAESVPFIWFMSTLKSVYDQTVVYFAMLMKTPICVEYYVTVNGANVTYDTGRISAWISYMYR